jgi:exodeoxyribonuclease V alpha subunit
MSLLRTVAEVGRGIGTGPPDVLVPFVDAGILGSADVHVANALMLAGGEDDPLVLLAAALAVRAPRRQHVCADLSRVRDLVGDHEVEGHDGHDTERDATPPLPWPDADDWHAALRSSPLVALHDPASLARPDDAGRACPPLVLAGDRLYLDRLWRDERLVARELRARAARTVTALDHDALSRQLREAFDASPPDRQLLAAATALTRHLAVIAGGPGTGKTTTVARILGLLDDQARATGTPLPGVALAAPTGKAAARLTESLREAAVGLAAARGDHDHTVARLRGVEATTVHRLLGPRADSRTRFTHHRGAPLPHDVIIVDETSMVSLALIARLLDAVRHDTRLVLLGDPEQLASVEAGSVLGDVVGDAVVAPTMHVSTHAHLRTVIDVRHLAGVATHGTTSSGRDPAERDAADRLPPDHPPGIDDAIVVLDRVHRFRADSGIASVAAAIQRGDEDGAVAALRAADDVRWIDHTAVDQPDGALRRDVVEAAGAAMLAARDGDAPTALRGLEQLRVLCAHRRGPAGVAGWVQRIERWLLADVAGVDLRGRWYAGRPVLITENDLRLQVVNGDVGIVVQQPDGRRSVALAAVDGAEPRLVAPTRLPATETVHAMTIHKSQGSQFAHVVVVLPDDGSPLLTRELLYTALTRGRERATLVAGEPAVRAAVRARAARASGLGPALRGPASAPDSP